MAGMATRRPMPPLMLPPYDFEEVPMADRGLSGSVVVKLSKREKWLSHLSSMLLLCNEAANRRMKKVGLSKKDSADGTQSKPLGLEYVADRLDTDDPLWGYQVRTLQEGWLQGFITVTTFTVWQRNFRWDSLAPENGVMQYDMQGRVWDKKGSLARELEAQPRDGDPDGEGIIWPTVAELSLLGGLGCGRVLVKLILEELESGGQYSYIVLQATDNAIQFYESMGFCRVGAVARYRDEQRKVPPEDGEPEVGGGGGHQLAGGAKFSRNKIKRDKSEGSSWSSKLPAWLQNKKFKFVVGGGGRASEGGASTSKDVVREPARQEGDFLIYVEEGWEPERKFRLFQRIVLLDGAHQVREWKAVRGSEVLSVGGGATRFVPLAWRAKVLPHAATLKITVKLLRSNVEGRETEVAEVDDEEIMLADAYANLRVSIAAGLRMPPASPPPASPPAQHVHSPAGVKGFLSPAAATPSMGGKEMMEVKQSPTTGPVVDWNDHSAKNVAKRQEAGFVAYCHWTFPEQSVDDIYPSYMMAKKLERKPAPPDGAMSLVRNKLMNNLPPVKQTRDLTQEHRAAEEAEYDPAGRPDLFNKVVTLLGRSESEYYYVLHYIRDMHWCHVVPMHAHGTFTGNTVRAGRPRYKLVPEGQGKELDLPGSCCKIVTAFTVSKTMDADKETWDIVSEEEAEEYTRLVAEEKRKGKKSEGAVNSPGGKAASREPPLWMQACERTLKKLMRHRSAWPFLEPVDPVALNLADYFEIVQNPMDLSTIKAKLESFGYPRAEDFVADVRLVFDNAMLYNPLNDKVHQLAVVMSDCLERDWVKEEAKLAAKGVRVHAGMPKPRPGQDAAPEFNPDDVVQSDVIVAEQGCWVSQEDPPEDLEGASASSTVEFFEAGFPRSPVLR